MKKIIIESKQTGDFVLDKVYADETGVIHYHWHQTTEYGYSIFCSSTLIRELPSSLSGSVISALSKVSNSLQYNRKTFNNKKVVFEDVDLSGNYPWIIEFNEK